MTDNNNTPTLDEWTRHSRKRLRRPKSRSEVAAMSQNLARTILMVRHQAEYDTLYASVKAELLQAAGIIPKSKRDGVDRFVGFATDEPADVPEFGSASHNSEYPVEEG